MGAVVNAVASIPDRRALLHSVGQRLVRAVASESGDYADALLDVLAERQPRGWTDEEWDAALAELNASRLTVNEFLSQEHAR